MAGAATASRIGINQTSVDWYWNSLGKYPREKTEAAVKACIDTEDYFPSIASVKRRLDTEAASEPKARDWADFNDLKRAAVSPLAKDALALIFEALDGNLNPQMLHDAMLDMETRYPGIGWSQEAHKYLKKANEYKSHSDSWHKDPNRKYYHKPDCFYARGGFQNPEMCGCRDRIVTAKAPEASA